MCFLFVLRHIFSNLSRHTGRLAVASVGEAICNRICYTKLNSATALAYRNDIITGTMITVNWHRYSYARVVPVS